MYYLHHYFSNNYHVPSLCKEVGAVLDRCLTFTDLHSSAIHKQAHIVTYVCYSMCGFYKSAILKPQLVKSHLKQQS